MGSQLLYVNLSQWGDYIGSVTLAADSVSMDVSAIPAGYRFLVVMISTRLEAAKPATTLCIQLNADGGNSYSFLKAFFQPGDVFGTVSLVSTVMYGVNVDSGYFAMSQFQIAQIPTGSPKGYTIFGGDPNQGFLTTGSWSGIVAVNQITLTTASGDKFKAGSQFHVYGVR